MSAPERYDLRITNADGESHGFVADWARGGTGGTIEKAANLDSTRLASKGEYGIKDVNDYMRIVQTDWSHGCAQETYDREEDSESAFRDSWSVDTSKTGSFRIGPAVYTKENNKFFGPIIAHGGDESSGPWVWASMTDDDTATNRVFYSADGATWHAIETAGPLASPTSFASDGAHLFMAAGGKAYALSTAAAGVASVSASDSDITHVASAAGVLYGAKGSGSVAAQVGAYSAITGATWTAITPLASEAIGAYGSTFGLVTLGTYVYWGVTNGMYTKVYKVRRGDGDAIPDVLEDVATFPSGFVGSCMYSYIDTVYVGGAFGTSGNGLGAIYAVVNDTPALLTNVGTTPTDDNRVLAMTGWERNLYFVANGSIWRWDLVNGGYSHWAGPLNSTAVMNYADIDWTGGWPMTASPSTTGSELEAGSPTTSGTTSAHIVDSKLVITLDKATAGAWRSYHADADSVGGDTSAIDDATGTTIEVDLPDDCIAGTRAKGGKLPVGFCIGIGGSSKAGFVKVDDDAYGYCTLTLMSGNRRSDGTAVASASIPNGGGTLRVTLKELAGVTYLTAYWNSTRLWSAPVTAPASPAKTCWIQAFKTTGGMEADATVTFGEVRWTDDGAYDSYTANSTTVSGVGLAAMSGRIFAACSGYACVSTMARYRTATSGETTVPYLRSSRSAANMPTVDKYFHGLVVNLENILPDAADLETSVTIDGVNFILERDTSLSTDTELFFPIGATGKNISVTFMPTTTNAVSTPVVTEAAVLCRAMPKTTKLYSYYLRLWDNVEGPNGQAWNENPSVCANFLEESANTTVTVEHPHGEYTGTIESMEFVEAPPSGQSRHRQGLYRINVRRLS